MTHLSQIQFEKWNEHDVANWLKGLDDSIHPFIPDFIEEGMDGKKLMMITYSDLDKLGVIKLGHQELILEGVDLLKSMRYMFETENLQHLALQLGCKARSLHNDIVACNGENDPNRANVQTSRNHRQLSVSILSSVCDMMSTLKMLASWLDRSPFENIYEITLLRNSIVKLGLELVTDAQRETSVSEVENAVLKSCQDMTEYCDKLVLNMKESLVVQPAFLEMAVIRKKQDDELGMHIQSSYCGIHVISCIKDRSPADLCSKVEKGDEVIQVNGQTVLGWQLVNLVTALKDKPKELTMLLKKRPRHASPFGLLPHKRQQGNRHHVPSVATLPKNLKKRRSREGDKPARPTLQEYVTSSIPMGDIYITKESPEDTNDGNDTDNEVFRSGSESPQFTLPVIVDAKQRRATVSGGSPTFERPLLVVEDLSSGGGPVRPKSQAINQAEKKAAMAALLASDSALSPKPSAKGSEESKGKHELVIDQEEAANNKDISTNEVTATNEVIATSEVTAPHCAIIFYEHDRQADQVDSRKSLSKEPTQPESCDPIQKFESEKSDKEETSTKEDASMDQDIAMSHAHVVKKPTPVSSSISTSSSKRQKIVKTEVAGNGRSGDMPQLVRVRRLDSSGTPETTDDDDVFVKVNKKVGFSDNVKDCEPEESFTHIVIGNVVQKIPTQKAGSFAKPMTVQMRKKTGSSKTKLDRRVSCKDLGRGDCEGWLYKRKQSTLSKNWVKRWCVLKKYNFFYFKEREDLKAEGVIHLPAFQVSPAPSLKTKKFAFKIHNTGTGFYFASERQDDMGKWMNKMGLAAISYQEESEAGNKDNGQDKDSLGSSNNTNEDFSESEDEGDDDRKHLGSLQSLTSVSSLGSTTSPHGSPIMMRRQQLAQVKGTVGASTEGLHSMLQTIHKNNLTLDGKDKADYRKSQITATADLSREDQQEVEKLRKLSSLQRTLKAKEQEVEDIDRLMNSSLTSQDLNQFVDHHHTATDHNHQN